MLTFVSITPVGSSFRLRIRRNVDPFGSPGEAVVVVEVVFSVAVFADGKLFEFFAGDDEMDDRTVADGMAFTVDDVRRVVVVVLVTAVLLLTLLLLLLLTTLLLLILIILLSGGGSALAVLRLTFDVVAVVLARGSIFTDESNSLTANMICSWSDLLKSIPIPNSVRNFLAVRAFMASFLSVSSSSLLFVWLPSGLFGVEDDDGVDVLAVLGVADADGGASSCLLLLLLPLLEVGAALDDGLLVEDPAAAAALLLLPPSPPPVACFLICRARCFLIRCAVAVDRKNPFTLDPPMSSREMYIARSVQLSLEMRAFICSVGTMGGAPA